MNLGWHRNRKYVGAQRRLTSIIPNAKWVMHGSQTVSIGCRAGCGSHQDNGLNCAEWQGGKGRICRDTQSRIRAVARELGYQKQSTMPVPLSEPATNAPPKMAGLLLSAASPASSLALIPGRDTLDSMTPAFI